MAWCWQIWWAIKLTPEQGPPGARREPSTASLSALAGPESPRPRFVSGGCRQGRVGSMGGGVAVSAAVKVVHESQPH
jgi:hypothetical protein